MVIVVVMVVVANSSSSRSGSTSSGSGGSVFVYNDCIYSSFGFMQKPYVLVCKAAPV